ncbi:hypothetical protein SUNI508_12534 [Seiridium unicorne]|uniref:Uncharacterized protein n=1 Tax=Seiridium unicorne TaxID=138068 RepID=A0ABR2VGX1_9PEZI
MASVFARTLPSSLSSRTIFVKCSPAPTTFAERRAVLKALATTGKNRQIEVFKKLEDSSSFIAVTADPECAKALVGDSPYKRIVHAQDSAAAATFATAAWGAAFRTTITDPVNVQPLNEESQGESKQAGNTIGRGRLGLRSKIFTLHVFPANAAYSHKRTIGLNPLHGPWPDNEGYDTFVSTALRRSLPPGHMSPGLRDWETGNQLSQDAAGFEAESAESLLGVTKQRAFFHRERRRRVEAELPDVMRSLAAVAESSTTPSPRRIDAEAPKVPDPTLPIVEEPSTTRIETSSVPSAECEPSVSGDATNILEATPIEDNSKRSPEGSEVHDLFKSTSQSGPERGAKTRSVERPVKVFDEPARSGNWSNSRRNDERITSSDSHAVLGTSVTQKSATDTQAHSSRNPATSDDLAWDNDKSVNRSWNRQASKKKTSDGPMSSAKFHDLLKGS